MFRMGEVLDDRVLGGGDPGGEGAEQFVCAHCGGPANQRCTGTARGAGWTTKMEKVKQYWHCSKKFLKLYKKTGMAQLCRSFPIRNLVFGKVSDE
jgi:hypothetical protein